MIFSRSIQDALHSIFSILLMDKFQHQFDIIIYRVSFKAGGCLGFLNHQQYCVNRVFNDFPLKNDGAFFP